MDPGDSETTTEALLTLLDQAYSGPSWHGATLRSSVARMAAELAFWRPPGNRHSIAEQVLHAAYWKYGATRQLVPTQRGAFALRGSDWPPIPGPPDDATWRSCRVLLDECHQALRDAIARFDPERWPLIVPRKKVSYANLARGVALHDIYHGGQIKLLVRLAGEQGQD